MPHWRDIVGDFTDTPSIIDEEEFSKLIKTGHIRHLHRSFLWASTKEGHDYWRSILDRTFSVSETLPEPIMERVKEIYVEAKLLV